MAVILPQGFRSPRALSGGRNCRARARESGGGRSTFGIYSFFNTKIQKTYFTGRRESRETHPTNIKIIAYKNRVKNKYDVSKGKEKTTQHHTQRSTLTGRVTQGKGKRQGNIFFF